ncbi:MAG TPA: ABC transporter ATP-binding protein [Opitutae bacterium]|nr:ABC transporter ATP-binding protein [Puniceicoccaceae bacterium]HCY57923.1 ABC transporter ATP-binding protein [Opitutae bacterium]|tara:strand:+ start:12630 stop:13340 length:711 start_codon:yes stop_codon:yes gene_type:complete
MTSSLGSEIPSKSLLEAFDLRHSFVEGDLTTEVLSGVSLKVEPGEITAVVGPSGCGKSTLLYLLGLLDRPDQGNIFLRGKEVSGCDDKTRTTLRNQEIGFIFQFHFLIKELSALENVALPLRKAGNSILESRKKAQASLTKLGLGDKSHRFANKLSGGEQQRVAIARAIVNSPSIVLADEPTGNLDSENSNKVFNLLSKLATDENLSILLVTHNNELAMKCNRVIEMRDGVITNSL